MKKRLKISELKVKSFVTEAKPHQVLGGSNVLCNASDHSCNQDIPSCNPICIINSFEQPCLRDVVSAMAC